MSATEAWCVIALALAVGSLVLSAIAPRAIDSYTARTAAGLLAGSVGALAVALWIYVP